MLRRSMVGASVLLLFVAASSRAVAQVPANPESTALAESLFQQGRQLMDEGELAQACKTLEASLAIESAIGTLLNLGLCYEKQGRLASAWSMFVSAENAALSQNQKRRAALARRRKELLDARVPRVVIRLSEQVDERVELSIDGRVLSSETLGLALPLDPGRHTVSVTLPDGRSTKRVFWCHERQGLDERPNEVLLPPFSPAPSSAPADQPESSFQGTTSSQPMPDSPPMTRRRPRWIPPTLVGFGAAALGTGVFLGYHAVDQAQDADCDANFENCSEDGIDHLNDARAVLFVGYGVGIAGGVLAATGVGTWVWFAVENRRRELSVGMGASKGTPLGVHLNAKF